jgi:hypothetical protein
LIKALGSLVETVFDDVVFFLARKRAAASDLKSMSHAPAA